MNVRSVLSVALALVVGEVAPAQEVTVASWGTPSRRLWWEDFPTRCGIFPAPVAVDVSHP